MSDNVTAFPATTAAPTAAGRTIINIGPNHIYHDLIVELSKQEPHLFPSNPTARLAAEIARMLVTGRRYHKAHKLSDALSLVWELEGRLQMVKV